MKEFIKYVIKWLAIKENMANVALFLPVLYALIETYSVMDNKVLSIIGILGGILAFWTNIKDVDLGGEDAEL